jgi:hypothetical protein
MAGRYDDLFKRKEQERERQRATAEDARRRAEVFQSKYVEWRNDVKEKFRKGAQELERAYPQLGQLFVQDIQDDLEIRKGKYPAGNVVVHFDSQQQTISVEIRFYGATTEVQDSRTHEYRMELAPTGDGIVVFAGSTRINADNFVHKVLTTSCPELSENVANVASA